MQVHCLSDNSHYSSFKIVSHDGRQHSVCRFSTLPWVRVQAFNVRIAVYDTLLLAVFKGSAGNVFLLLAEACHNQQMSNF